MSKTLEKNEEVGLRACLKEKLSRHKPDRKKSYNIVGPTTLYSNSEVSVLGVEPGIGSERDPVRGGGKVGSEKMQSDLSGQYVGVGPGQK